MSVKNLFNIVLLCTTFILLDSCMKKKTSLQKTILDFVSRKRFQNIDEMIEELEGELLKNKCTTDRIVKPRYVLKRTIKQLANRGEISLRESENHEYAQITGQGRHKLRSLLLGDDNQILNQSWDGKWRIALLDVDEDRKDLRNALRYILKKARFVKLKNSVWISPYPLEHFLAEMKKDLNLTDEMMVITADEIDESTQEVMKNVFGGS